MQLRLGYFPNVTHAPAIIGVETGLFADALGPDVELRTSTFNSGTEVVEALRVVSGTTSGGAALVVRDGIDTPDDLAGATLATPSLGNTQDVALRAWLQEQGFETDTSGGGEVQITPQDNADTLAGFQQGALDGAWVPEPWATRLVEEGGATVLVDEAELWPEGRFVTTHLVFSTDFLEEHPAVVRDLLTGLGQAVDQANGDPQAAQQVVNDGIEAVTTSRLSHVTIAGAWEHLEFTLDPVASSLWGSADDAVEVGLLEPVDLTAPGIYDLDLLNEVLAERGDGEVSPL